MSGSASHSCTMPIGADADEHAVEQAVGAEDLAPHDTGDHLGQHVGAKNRVRSTARPLDAGVEQDGQAERERDLEQQRQDDDRDVVAQRIAEQWVGERPRKLSSPTNFVERLEAVPVVQAVPRALHDRVEHEDPVEQRAPGSRKPATTHPWHSAELRRGSGGGAGSGHGEALGWDR